MPKPRKKQHDAETLEPEPAEETADEGRISLDDAGTELEDIDVSQFLDDDEHASEGVATAEVQEQLGKLRAELEEAVEARQRALADFVNFQRRARDNETRALRDGACGVVRALLPILDHLDMALGQDREQMTLQQLFEGVSILRDELMKVLENHLVDVVDPEPGSEFDPNQHQAVSQQPTSEYAPNSIVMVLQVGYVMGDVVLRPATVVVSSVEDEEQERE